MENQLFLVMPLALMCEVEMNENSTLSEVLERIEKYPLEKGGWIEIFQSSTGRMRVGAGRVSFKVDENEKLTFYSCGEQGYKNWKGWNKPTLYVVVSQNYYSSYKIINRKTTYTEIIEEHINNDHKSGGYNIEIVQSKETPVASWGEIVYKVDDGVLQFINSKVDSSG